MKPLGMLPILAALCAEYLVISWLGDVTAHEAVIATGVTFFLASAFITWVDRRRRMDVIAVQGIHDALNARTVPVRADKDIPGFDETMAKYHGGERNGPYTDQP